MTWEHRPLEDWMLLAAGEAEGGRKEWEAHVAACPECAALRDEARNVFGLLAEDGRRLSAPPVLCLPLAVRRSSRRVIPWALAAGAARVAGAALLLTGLRSPAAKVAWSFDPAIRADASVRPGDRLETGAKSTAGLAFPNGALAALAPDTEAFVESASAVRLQRGSLHVRSAPKGFTIRTPQGTVEDLGTSFAVRIASGRTIVVVLKGSVRGSSARGDAGVVEALQRGEIGAGLKIETAPPSEISEASEWMRRTPFGPAPGEGAAIEPPPPPFTVQEIWPAGPAPAPERHEALRADVLRALDGLEAGYAEAVEAFERIPAGHPKRDSIASDILILSDRIATIQRSIQSGNSDIVRGNPGSALRWYRGAGTWSQTAQRTLSELRAEIRKIR
ncbi:MAG: FecR domain-containing protein [Planctomycetota bacterium]